MPITVPWVQKKQEQAERKNAREANTKEENELLDLAQDRFEASKVRKVDDIGRSMHERWNNAEQMYRGRQWREQSPSHRSQPVLNFMFSMIESAVPRLTDSRPEIDVLPRHEIKHGRLAEMLADIQGYLWYHNRMPRRTVEMVRTGLKLGTAIIKTIWDTEAHGGLGEVYYGTVHPMNFFPDPRAYEIEDMEYCTVRVPKPMEYYLRRWETKGKLVVPDQGWIDTEREENVKLSSPEELASLNEYWFRDEEGNLCVMYYAGDIVLDVLGGIYESSHDPQPLYKHNRFPFAKFVDYPADKEFWGISEIEIVELLNRLINALAAQIVDNTRLMANAQWVVNKVLSGLTEDDSWMFDSAPGRVIWTYNGGVDRLSAESVPAHIPEFMERLIYAMEQILGIHDVVQGRRPVGVRAASAIIALQESANVRIREKARGLEDTYREIADQANWLVLEHYTEERQMRMAGHVEPSTLDIRKALEEQIVDQAIAQQYMDAGVTPDQLEPDDIERLVKHVGYPEFDVEVNVGSTIQQSQALTYETAKELFAVGAIDQRGLLDAIKFPGRETIIERMQQQAMAMAEQERTGERTFGGPQGPPMPGPPVR